MYRFVIILVLLALNLSCRKPKESDAILGSIEKGTGSTYKKEYNSEHQLQVMTTTYRSGKYKTVVYYDFWDNHLKEIKGYLSDHLYGHNYRFRNDGSVNY